MAQSGSNLSSPYGPSVLAQIPMKQLLQYARQHQGTYATLYPSFLRLTATHLPQLCLVEEWLREEGLSTGGQSTADVTTVIHYLHDNLTCTNVSMTTYKSIQIPHSLHHHHASHVCPQIKIGSFPVCNFHGNVLVM